MANYKTKKKNSIGKVVGMAVLSVLLSGVLLVGGGVVGYGAGTDWTYKKGGVQATQPDIPDIGDSEIDNTENLLQLSESENNGVKANIRALKSSEYQNYAIGSDVLSAAVATVTLANHNEATDKSISLTAAFLDAENSEDFFAADYIRFSADTVNSGEEFTIECIQAFSEPITIIAVANGSEANSTGSKQRCTLKADFVKRLKGIELWLGSRDYDFSEDSKQALKISMNLYKNETSTISQSVLPIYYDKNLDNNFGLSIDALAIDCSCKEDTLSDGTIFENFNNIQLFCTNLGVNPISVGGTRLDDQFEARNFDTLTYQVAGYSSGALSAWWSSNIDNQLGASLGKDYQRMQEAYLNNIPSNTLYVRFTGETTGIRYIFATNIVVDPAEMYVAAQDPSFDDNTSGGIIF